VVQWFDQLNHPAEGDRRSSEGRVGWGIIKWR